MALSVQRITELQSLAKKMRIDIITALHKVQTGHPGGSLSAVEILTVLYFSQMRNDCAEPNCPDRDRFVASKGHCAPVVYTTLCEKGYFDRDEIGNLRQLGCMLQGHPDMKKVPGVDMSTGSLGLGLSVGIGMAMAAKMSGKDYRTYVLLGDGELQEGQIWEAAMSAPRFGLSNLVAIVDNNGVQLDGLVEDIMPLGSLRAKFEAFGWKVVDVDGHDIAALDEAFDQIKQSQTGPVIVLAKTVKGKGVSFMEGKNEWHGKAINNDQFKQAMADLGGSC